MKPQIRAVVIDDEAAARSLILIYLKDFCPEIQVVGEACGVQTGISVITETSPDLIFLDIHLQDGSGFDLLKEFSSPSFRIIFITAYDNFAYKAFQYSAVDYLLKPVDPLQLKKAVEKIQKQSQNDNYLEQLKTLLENLHDKKAKKIALSASEGLIFLNLNEICRLESKGNYTTFHSKGERFVVAKSLKEYEQLLPGDQFFRIHQSHLVNIHCVHKILKEEGGAVLMNDGSKLPLARRKKDTFIQRLTQNSL
ncbi:MAG: DNA-binding response regulator [Saprospiraceae bacterium]|nr:MAG: DNA-binding response regulator [Saprospiraceae bacterium]